MQRRSFLSLLPVAVISATGIRGLFSTRKPAPIGVDAGSGQSWSYVSYISDLVTAGHKPTEILKYTPMQLCELHRAIGAG